MKMSKREWNGPVPVSYTHLDVYKRQAAYGLRSVGAYGAGCLVSIGAGWNPDKTRLFERWRPQWIASVSYTHLDVYKRQGSHTDTHTERSIGAVPEQSQEAGVVAILQATIDTLQGQLSVKDKQIEELNARLAEVSSCLLYTSRCV